MRIYIDSDFKCHLSNPDGLFQEIETDAFEGNCDAYVEGCRFVPYGMRWTRPDGEIFEGEMVAPHGDFAAMEEAQLQYEREKLAEFELLINELYQEVL